MFNLKKPYDLVTFIQQEVTLDKLRSLQEDLTEEKKRLEVIAKTEDTEFQKRFHISDPDCIAAEKHIQNFEVFHSCIVPFSSKGIKYVLVVFSFLFFSFSFSFLFFSFLSSPLLP